MKRKGQFISLLVIVTMLFITSGNFLGALMVKNKFKERINYNSGGLDAVSEAKVRSDLWEKRTRREIKYAANNVAWDMRQWNKGGWIRRNFEPEKFRKKIKADFRGRVTNIVKRQNQMSKCKPAPGLKLKKMSKNPLKFRYEVKHNWVKCSSENTISAVNTTDKIVVKHAKNRFFTLTDGMISIVSNTKDAIPGPNKKYTGSVSTDRCYKPDNFGISQRRKLKEEAEAEAKKKAQKRVKEEINIGINRVLARPRLRYVVMTKKKLEIKIRDSRNDENLIGKNCPNNDEKKVFIAEDTVGIDKVKAKYRLADDKYNLLTEEGTTNLKFQVFYRHDVG